MDNLSFYVHLNHRCGMHMKMSYFDFVMLPLWLATMVCSFFFLHVSRLWLVIPQFVQHLSIFLVLPCVFGIDTCLVLYGIESALLPSAIIILFSHNNVATLCCSVDLFILIVAILRYDCKPTLTTVINKLSLVGTCKLWANF